MNETLELWSAPWHSLQRSLAATLGTEMSRLIAGVGVSVPTEREPTGVPTWLARARLQIKHVAGRGQ
jgi:hypothetical protein